MIDIQDSSLLIKSCIGALKLLVQLMIRKSETSLKIPTLGIVSLNIKKKKLTIEFDDIETTLDGIINNSRNS